jgi:uncharacterized protein (DUF433 family)
MDCEPEFDMPPQAGHAVPQWLRDQFSTIEDNAMRMGGCAVFTQMRTKVQAYFEMLRADLSYSVVLVERNKLKADNTDLHATLQAAKGEIERLKAENESLRKDAERYRWFRAQHWDSSAICAVVDPKTSTKLGAYCPSADLLDSAIDTAISLGMEARP